MVSESGLRVAAITAFPFLIPHIPTPRGRIPETKIHHSTVLREGGREGETEGGRERERESDRRRRRKRETDGEGGRERQREGERSRERGKESERQREGERDGLINLARTE